MVEQDSAPSSSAAAKATMPDATSAVGNQARLAASIAPSQRADRLDRSRLPLIALLFAIMGVMVASAHLLAEQAVGLLSHAGDRLAHLDVYSFAFTYALLFFLLVNLPLLMIIGYRGIKAEVLTDAVQRSLALAGVKEPFLVARMREFRGRQGLWTYILPALVSLGMLFMAISMAMLPQGITGLVVGIGLNPAAPRLSMGGVLSHAISQTSPHVWTILGAYFQGILILLQSWLRSEFTNESIWRFNVRLLKAFVVGLLLLALFNVTGQDLGVATPMLSAFAFFAGMVPEQAMRWIARRLQGMGAVDAAALGIFDASDLPRHIPGMTFWQQERLSSDGVESVQDLAFQDIPEMLMRNRLDGKLLMRWVDRALLCAQAGNAADQFRLAHIDTATALAVAMDGKAEGFPGLQALQDDEPGLVDGPHASKQQASMASAPMAPELVQSIAAGLDQSPNLRYLQAFVRNVGMPGDCCTREAGDSGSAIGVNPVLPEPVRRQDLQSPGACRSRPEPSAHSQEPLPMSNYRVIVDALELRAGPGTNYEILEQLPNGTELEQVPPSPHWTKVRRVSDGRIGWVYNAYIRPTQPEPDSVPVAAATPAVSPAPVLAASPSSSPALSPSIMPGSSPASNPVPGGPPSGQAPNVMPTAAAGRAIPVADTAEPVLNDAAGADLAFDISHFQPDVDFRAAYAGGLRAVFHKATEGINYVDPRYASARTQAAAAGLLWGAYHFGTGDDALAQAEHFLCVAKPDGNTLLVLDLERNPQGPSMTIEQARTFASHLQQVTGKWPGLYSGSYIRDNLGNVKDPVLSNCWFWLAEYGPVPHVPPTWGQWSFWQHTDGNVGPGPQSVPGCGPCDRDRFAGDAEALAAFWRANA
jgi:lysozyme